MGGPGPRAAYRPVLAFDLAPPELAAPASRPSRAAETVASQAIAPSHGASVPETPAPAPAPAPAASAPSLPIAAPLSDARAALSLRNGPAEPVPPDTAGLQAAYAVTVWQHVARFKPRGVRLAGTPLVRIEIAGDGALLSAALERSSGVQRLDRLALETTRRAAPFPPPPTALAAAERVFLVPFAFQ